METQTPPEPLVSIETVADHLGMTTATLRKWRQRGTMPFPAYSIGRVVRFKLSEVAAWVETRAHQNPVEARLLSAL